VVGLPSERGACFLRAGSEEEAAGSRPELLRRLSMALSRMLVLVLLSVLIASCEPRIPRAVLPEEPTRVLHVLILVEDGIDQAQVNQLIKEVNPVLIRQVGIALWPMAHASVEFPSRKRNEMLQALYETTLEVQDHFDLYIAFARKTPWDRVKRTLFGDWLGVIDDTFRRYIVIKELDKRVLAHEIYHAFIESDGHSGCGMMAPLLELLPGIALNYSMELCEQDRAEILANRDRRFDDGRWPVTASGAVPFVPADGGTR
jgi:hypothetical protein